MRTNFPGTSDNWLMPSCCRVYLTQVALLTTQWNCPGKLEILHPLLMTLAVRKLGHSSITCLTHMDTFEEKSYKIGFSLHPLCSFNSFHSSSFAFLLSYTSSALLLPTLTLNLIQLEALWISQLNIFKRVLIYFNEHQMQLLCLVMLFINHSQTTCYLS